MSPLNYSLLNNHPEAYDSAYSAADCPPYCWICYHDDSVPANLDALPRFQVLRHISRIAKHGSGVYADGLRLALDARGE